MKIPAKKIIADALGSSFFGSILLRLGGGSVSRRGLRYDFGRDPAFHRTAARIFFGFYESAEKRMILKYLPQDQDVVELGGSVGFVSTLIRSKIGPNRLHIVAEPDSKLALVAGNNLNLNFGVHKSVVLNSPYGTPGRKLVFEQGASHIAGKLIELDSNEESHETVSLEAIKRRFEIERFSLVMDIEGAESMLIYDEPQALAGCNCIIAELHETVLDHRKIKVGDLVSAIENLGFSLHKRDGNVFVFMTHG